LSVWSLLGRFLGRPRRGLRIAEMVSTASSKSFESWTLAAEWVTERGMPSLSTTMWRFEPDLPLSVGFLPVFGPPGGYACRVQRCPLPVDLVRLAQPVQQGWVQLFPHTRLVPFLETTPAPHPRAASHLLGQHLPGDTALEHEQDAGESCSVVDVESARPGAWVALRAAAARSLPKVLL
jgi:hypothetical protein